MINIEKNLLNRIKKRHKKTNEYSEFIDVYNIMNTFGKNVAIISAIVAWNNRNDIRDIQMLLSNDDIISRYNKFRKIISQMSKILHLQTKELTPLNRVEQHLDMLDQSIFSNKNAKVLDPSAGIGNYQIVLIDRFMNGLSKDFPDLIERFNYIVENIIYVCEKNPLYIQVYKTIIDPTSTLKQNIYCGSLSNIDFKDHINNVWKVEKFDLVCCYPKQYDNSKKYDSSSSLFDVYITKILNNINSEQYLFLTVGRWLFNGSRKKIVNFRKNIFNRSDIKNIIWFDNSNDFFNSSVTINGGMLFLHIDKKYKGCVKYNNSELDLKKYDILVEDKYKPILDKILQNKHNMLDFISRSKCYYGYNNLLKKHYSLTPKSPNDIKIYIGSKSDKILGIDPDKINERYINKFLIKNYKHNHTVLNYKVLINARTSPNSIKKNGLFGNIIIAQPNEISCETYLPLFVKTELEANNLKTYLDTTFCKFLVLLRKSTQHIDKTTLEWIPLMDLNKKWNDDSICSYFNITKEEFMLMEEKINIKN